MNCYVLAFKNRNLQDVSNKFLREIYNGSGPKYDLELISSDQKVINAHTLVVAMFSDFIRDYLIEFKPTKNKICVPLNISSFVLQLVVDLIYNGQIMVGEEVKPRIAQALQQLKIKDVFVSNPADQQTSTPPPSTIKPKTPASVAIRPTSNLTASKSVSASVPNLQQVTNGQPYKRELSSNSMQYANTQLVKRPRSQSVYIDNPSQRFNAKPTGMAALPLEVRKRLGGLLSVSKVKVTPVAKNIPKQSFNQQVNDYGGRNMEY